MHDDTGRGVRLSVVRLVGASVLAAAIVHAAVSAQTAAIPRVRSTHDYIRAMIAEAVQRSPTLRRLVEAIGATNGIVYVEQGECGHSVRACLTLTITPTAEYRFLRVLVDARQPDWQVMSSIGHELQHALEVLENISLTSAEAIFLFYAREGMTMGESFETPAAVRIGNAVRNEVGSYARRRAF